MKISTVVLGLVVSSPLVVAVADVATKDDSSVQKKPDKIEADIVDLRFNSGLKPEEITDEHLDYLEFAMQYAFDETNPNHMYKSVGVKVEVFKPDDDDELQGGEGLERIARRSYYAHVLNQRGCQFCPQDDAFLSDSDNMVSNQKTLKNWAKAVCDALNESSLDGFKDADGCKINLPYGGVGDEAPVAAEEEDLTVVSLTPKKSRVVHSGKKKEDDPMAGEDNVDVHFSMDISPDEVTDSHLEYLALAMQLSFDETNQAHMYRSTGVIVNYMELEDDRNTNKEGVLRGVPNTVGWTFSKWYASILNRRGCQFCPQDDAFLSENPLGNEKTLKNWAKSLCDALNDSPLEGFKKAKGCVIELPQGGVGASESDASTSVA